MKETTQDNNIMLSNKDDKHEQESLSDGGPIGRFSNTVDLEENSM